MTEQECIDELLAKGWANEDRGLYVDSTAEWHIYEGPTWELCWNGGLPLRFAPESPSLPALLSATMPGSASVTVATYFGLRAPGVV